MKLSYLALTGLIAYAGGAWAQQPTPVETKPLTQDVADQIASGNQNFTISLQDPTVKVVGASVEYTVGSIDELMSAIRQNTVNQTLPGLQPITIGYNYLKFGDRIVYDMGADLKEDMKNSDKNSFYDIYQDDYKPLSVVGNIISFYHETAGYFQDAAHPNSGRTIMAVSGETGEHLSLSDLAEEKSVVTALQADGYLQKKLPRASRAKLATAKTLAQASKALEGLQECDASWYGAEKNFAVTDYDAKTGKITVRIALAYGAETCRGSMVQLGLVVTARPEMKEALAQAKQKTSGFLVDPQVLKDISKP